jgi:hypothetical protein
VQSAQPPEYAERVPDTGFERQCEKNAGVEGHLKGYALKIYLMVVNSRGIGLEIGWCKMTG